MIPVLIVIGVLAFILFVIKMADGSATLDRALGHTAPPRRQPRGRHRRAPAVEVRLKELMR